jgi:26S proteasome regulatory subunit N8
MFRQYSTHEPVFVIIDVRSGIQGIPTTAYEAIEEVESEGKEIHRAFKHISCMIEAEEAEEVGVEHLLRDINDPSTSSLALQIQQKLNSLSGLVSHLIEIRDYLQNVLDGRLPINNQISYNLQDIFNLLPNLNVEILVKAMLVKTNDMHLAVYLSSLVRSVIALHNLLNNKIKYKDLDQILDRSAGIEATSSPQVKDPATGPSSESKTSK